MSKEDIIEKHLDDAGEVILHVECGDKLEIHKHDTRLNGNHIIVDKDEERHIVFYDSITAFDVHESGWE